MSPESEQLLNGRYRVVRVLGSGGMGQVLLAQDLAEGGREIALKTVPRDGRDDFAHMQHEFLTLSPLVIGADQQNERPSLVEGAAFAPGTAPSSTLISLRRGGDYLFLRSRYPGA